MDVVLSLLVVAALLGLLLFLRTKRSSENVRPPVAQQTPDKNDTTFHAVSIVFAKNACKAAMNMQGRRFLSGAAPKIPLPDCDALECRCRFAHHTDRRSHDDRRNPYLRQFGGGETGNHQQEQRTNRERRDDPPDSF
jgi:hypothetical protein